MKVVGRFDALDRMGSYFVYVALACGKRERRGGRKKDLRFSYSCLIFVSRSTYSFQIYS